MAEALLQTMGGERFEAVSAGFEPGKLNPLAVAAMSELGIDISGNATRSVFSFYRAGALFDYVITVCDEASKEKCPIFPGFAERRRSGRKALGIRLCVLWVSARKQKYGLKTPCYA